MKINKILSQHPQKAEGKKRTKKPNRSFQEVMAKKGPFKFSQKRYSPLDLASEKEQTSRLDSKKKQEPSFVQHGEIVSPLFLSTTEQTPEIMAPLPKDMIALMEKITSFIQVETEKGITTTTLTLDMEGSVFNGSQITLQHYDTAPHSFNLELSSNPEGVNLFNAHLTSLQIALFSHSALQEIDVRILPPALREAIPPKYKSGREKKAGSLKNREKVADSKNLFLI